MDIYLEILNKEIFVNISSFVFVVSLVIIASGISFFYKREMRKYRRLIPKPEHLLKVGASLSIIEDPNHKICYAEVFDIRFSSKAVIDVVFNDILYLRNLDHKVVVSYVYDKELTQSEDIFQIILAEYHKDLSDWEKDVTKKQKRKPRAPYQYTKLEISC